MARGEPRLARLPARLAPLARLSRSLPATAAVTAAVALLTVVGVAATYVQARRDADARRATLAQDIRGHARDTVDTAAQRAGELGAALEADWGARRPIFAAVAPDLVHSPGVNGVGLIESRPPDDAFVVALDVQNNGPTAIGVNVAAEPSRRAALLAAATSDMPRATPPLRLRDGAAGTALFIPIEGPGTHRSARGLLSMSYRYEFLLRALRGAVPPGTAFALYDGPTRLLAQGDMRDPTRSRIAVAGRSWTLAVGAPAADLSLPLTILLVGTLLTLFVGVFGVQSKRRERYAEALVARRLAERELAERAREQAEERFGTAFAEAPIGMALTSLEGRFLQVNRALAEIAGYDEQTLLALPFASELTHPDDRSADSRAARAMRSGAMRVYDVEKRYLHAAGHVVWVAVHTTLIRNERGEPAHFLSQIEDITSRRRYESRLRHMADHDSLTGLLNRRAFEQRLHDQLRRGERYGHDGAVLVLDLDAFKEVNDTLGHGAGDELIVRVAAALATRVRDSDVLARLGGDEFAILMPRGGRLEAERLAEALLQTVRGERAARGPGGRERPMTASIGIAPLGGAVALSPEEALINADLAMYDAKEAGRDRSVTYGGSSRGRAGMETRLEWVERIRAALDEDRLVLHAQPVVETATGTITQHELLIRMVDDHGDLIPPQSFLQIAERFGLIRELDRWVVRHAIAMLAEHAAAGRRPTVEINLSGQSLGDPELAVHVGRALHASGVHPTQLIFEVTETTAIDNIAAARSFAEQLGRLGCRFALDDFGAGFGSFYYLKHLPFDFIKIDGEFIRNCATDPTDRLVIGAVVELARGMGKYTIAEFVGDDQTLAVLAELGVDYAQGFHLGRPAPLESWLDPAERRLQRRDP
ncbi:MAG TPA: EAL domain-containing protein [Solirubrobacteraceae bacterium]|nr:EAL domain-containing protein [Solirubrobacteraceae bacterium]